MNRLFLSIFFYVVSAGAAPAAEGRSLQEIKLVYKAYWAGFVISKVYSSTYIGPTSYQMDVSYQVTGLASIFSKMKNKVSARGNIAPDGSLKPLFYENIGSWGKHGYETRVEFQEQDGKIISHDYSFNFKEKFTYIPIKDELKFGPDMVSFYLGLTLDEAAMKVGSEMKHQNVFGGFFLLDIAYQCTQIKQQNSRRSIYKGEVLVCEFSDEVIDGDFEKVKKKKKKKKKKNRSDLEPVPVQIRYAKLEELGALNAMIPVYSEFAIGWGKVRVYLSGIEVITKSETK